MSLVSQIAALATRIATEIKAVRTEMSQLGGGAPDPHAATHAAGGSDEVTLAQSQVTNLTTDLAGKASTSHSHAISDVTTLQTELDGKIELTNGEIIQSLQGYGQFRAVNGTSPGFFIRNDGGNTYFLLSNNGDPNGSWNSLRPLYIANTSGLVTMNNGAIINGQVYTNSAQSTSSGTARFRNVRLSTSNPSGGIDGDVWLKYS